jgi:hypothetical protein
MIDPVIASSGTLLGLLQRGRGDGALYALAAPRTEALAALNHCVLNDPRHDWQVENRSLYYARLFLDLDGGLDEIEQHLFAADDHIVTEDSRTGLALSVLGHLASYDRGDALALLQRYATTGANWAWALDELALRDDDAGLRILALPVLSRFPATPQGEAELAVAVRDAYEPRPWRLWADDPREAVSARIRAAGEQGSFDRWQRQMRPTSPRPGWSVQAVFDWAQQGLDRGSELHLPAARCLTAVAGPQDRAAITEAARSGSDGARAAALHYLAEARDPAVLDLIEAAAHSPARTVSEAAAAAFERMCGEEAVHRARSWVQRPDALGASAAGVLAGRGGAQDAHLVLGALRETVRSEGPDARLLWTLADGAGRLGIACAVPVLRRVYRDTTSSQLRGSAARALAVTDPSFGSGFAVECLWDCEETTREVAALYAETGDVRVVDRLRRLAADPAEEVEVQTAVRSRIGTEGTAH